MKKKIRNYCTSMYKNIACNIIELKCNVKYMKNNIIESSWNKKT